MRRHNKTFHCDDHWDSVKCCILFSQQVNNQSALGEQTDTSLPKVETLEDIPDCSVDLDGTTEAACYAQAATLSTSWLRRKWTPS